MKMPTTGNVIDVTSGLLGLVLVGSGAWYWYNSNVQAHSTKQIAETAAREVRETAECQMEAFKMRRGSTQAALEIQAEFMDLCMAARAYVFLPDCTERMREGDRAWNLSYKFNSVCWRKN
jgi:2,4-dienoyl-CoA reductase-like NADH-dependent reductase (Old Yellow Enzyme family)